MGAFEVVETLPHCEPAVQLLQPRHNHSLELSVELLVVDSVGPFALAEPSIQGRTDTAVWKSMHGEVGDGAG
jgi:hypothetical protein